MGPRGCRQENILDKDTDEVGWRDSQHTKLHPGIFRKNAAHMSGVQQRNLSEDLQVGVQIFTQGERSTLERLENVDLS